MQQYEFTCPLDGCDHTKMTTSSPSREEAVTELSAIAKEHLATSHPEIHKTDEQIHSDISAMTQESDSSQSPANSQ